MVNDLKCEQLWRVLLTLGVNLFSKVREPCSACSKERGLLSKQTHHLSKVSKTQRGMKGASPSHSMVYHHCHAPARAQGPLFGPSAHTWPEAWTLVQNPPGKLLTITPVVCCGANNTSAGVRSKKVGPARLLAKGAGPNQCACSGKVQTAG